MLSGQQEGCVGCVLRLVLGSGAAHGADGGMHDVGFELGLLVGCPCWG